MLSSKQWNNKASDIKLVYLYSTNKFRYSTINNEVAKAGQGNWKLFSGPSVHTSRIVVAKVKAKFVLYSVPHRNAKQGRKFKRLVWFSSNLVWTINCWETLIHTTLCLFVFLARQPPVSYGLFILDVSRSLTRTHHTRYDSAWRVITSSQRPLPDNTQHSQHTNIHAPGGILTHNFSRRAAADLRLRPRGLWDQLIQPLPAQNYSCRSNRTASNCSS